MLFSVPPRTPVGDFFTTSIQDAADPSRFTLTVGGTVRPLVFYTPELNAGGTQQHLTCHR